VAFLFYALCEATKEEDGVKKMPFNKYDPYPTVDIADRSWPDRTITHAPVWCSVDLRDGNQSLSVPMDVEKKMEMFRFLVEMGFKEIEVGFPSASETEYRFIRKLIEDGCIPGEVTIQVLTQAREHLIEKTMDAVRGAREAVVHVYNPTSRQQREQVFHMDREQIKEMAVNATRRVREISRQLTGTKIRFEYTPESFTGTELDYSVEVCEAVVATWKPEKNEKVIINLPATVEMSTPNVYADRIEWFCRNIKCRDKIIVSVHTHNDRGTAVASAELAVMAGAERVEGALFGNGERCGNMDIVTMAMNLFSRGIDPKLDFSDIDRIRQIYCRCTRMDVHPRHPYAGELVYTAFSGSHQDAISKGMKARKVSSKKWDVPYLPIDPEDVGRTYEAIIRVNSQSGKGGAAFVLEKEFGIAIPKWMQADFGQAIQLLADRKSAELTSREIFDCFKSHYLEPRTAFKLESCHIESDSSDQTTAGTKVNVILNDGGREINFSTVGNGPVDAFIKGLQQSGIFVEVHNYAEHALSDGSESQAIAYVGIKGKDGKETFGAGTDSNISIASFKAVINALVEV
jgi:2-isopropylmalate synthase